MSRPDQEDLFSERRAEGEDADRDGPGGTRRLRSSDRAYFGQPFRDFENVGGVHLTDSVLWCDGDRKNGLNFVSSAVAAEVGRDRKVLCTEATLRLFGKNKRLPDALTAPFGHAIRVGALGLSLHQAGFILGAAQLRIEREGRVIVYARDVCPRASTVAPSAEPVPCDVLALAATHGGRLDRFPAREGVIEEIVRFVDASLEAKRPPVLLAERLRVAPDLAILLGRAGYRLRLHRAVADVLKLHEGLGVAVPAFKRLGKKPTRGDVVIAPPILRTNLSATLPEARMALVGPRATDAAHVHQLGVAEAFPLANVADQAELLAFVEATGAREVFLTGGKVEELGAALTATGRVVRDLRPQQQLSLF